LGSEALHPLWRADLMAKHAAIVGIRVGDEGKRNLADESVERARAQESRPHSLGVMHGRT